MSIQSNVFLVQPYKLCTIFKKNENFVATRKLFEQLF